MVFAKQKNEHTAAAVAARIKQPTLYSSSCCLAAVLIVYQV